MRFVEPVILAAALAAAAPAMAQDNAAVPANAATPVPDANMAAPAPDANAAVPVTDMNVAAPAPVDEHAAAPTAPMARITSTTPPRPTRRTTRARTPA